jgi:hypothetical protein
VVTFGVQSFLQYDAELHEANGYNAFDVTRGYLNIKARLNDRVSFRFTPDVRPTTTRASIRTWRCVSSTPRWMSGRPSE